MRRTLQLTVAVSALALTGLTVAPAALANSPHFIGTPTCTVSLTSGLTCSGKAAGLGNGPTVAFLTTERVEATYACQNKGEHLPPGQPVVTENVTGPEEKITPRNGQITFAPTIPPPPPPSVSGQCPNGRNWKLVLASLTYTNVVLHIQQPPGTDLLTASFPRVES
jgi:hypothetical protein